MMESRRSPLEEVENLSMLDILVPPEQLTKMLLTPVQSQGRQILYEHEAVRGALKAQASLGQRKKNKAWLKRMATEAVCAIGVDREWVKQTFGFAPKIHKKQATPPTPDQSSNEEFITKSKVTEASIGILEAKDPVKREFLSPEDCRIRLICWNISGQDEAYLERRTEAVCALLVQENVHIVLIQEVVEESEEIIRNKLSTEYEYVSTNDGTRSDYSAILVRKDVGHVEETRIVPFPITESGRNLLMIKCSVKGEKLCVMTSHLESKKQNTEKRMAQLKLAFSLMQKEDSCRTAVFGGDLSLRNHEINQGGGLPCNIYDIWELTGKRPDAKFTWDCQRNDNLYWSGINPREIPKLRLDRIYIRYSIPQSIKVEHFNLIGFKRIAACNNYFCSDHWGLLTQFSIITKMPK